jgi:hypothetical protein
LEESFFLFFVLLLKNYFVFLQRGNNAEEMKKVVYTLLLCAVWTLTAEAQNSMESIRKTYQEVHQWIAQMTPNKDGESEMPPEYYDLHVEQNLPGTGPHHEKIRMFYGEVESESGEDDFNPYPPHYLRFVTAKYNFAAREFYEEYLYDDKGQVMFIYAITPDVVNDGEMVPYELRMWFDGKRLLRFMAKKYEREDYSGTSIPELYRQEAERCQLRAQRFLTMFKGIDDNTYL